MTEIRIEKWEKILEEMAFSVSQGSVTDEYIDRVSMSMMLDLMREIHELRVAIVGDEK